MKNITWHCKTGTLMPKISISILEQLYREHCEEIPELDERFDESTVWLYDKEVFEILVLNGVDCKNVYAIEEESELAPYADEIAEQMIIESYGRNAIGEFGCYINYDFDDCVAIELSIINENDYYDYDENLTEEENNAEKLKYAEEIANELYSPAPCGYVRKYD